MKNLWERLSEQDKQTLNNVDKVFNEYMIRTMGKPNNYSWQKVLESKEFLSDLNIHQWAMLSQDLSHDTINHTYLNTFN